jgi:uncharacterized protein YndB with AHSA1/START domain
MNQTSAAVEGRNLIITRTFHAPRELVFRAWTDPAHLPQWWGPQGFTVTVQEIDIKPGGVWRYVMHGPDGTDYDNLVTFLDIQAPHRIEYKHGDFQNDEHFRVTVTLEEQGPLTHLTMTMQFPTVEALNQTIQFVGAIEGAQSTLERLNQQLPKITLSRVQGQEFVMERLFYAPRELVFRAFSEAEHLKHWWGPRGWDLTVCRIDFRVGGTWHYCMKCTDESQGEFFGMESWGKAEYREIVDGSKIVYVDYFSDADGNVSPGMPACEVTLNFEDCEGKTKVESISRYASAEELTKVIDMGMEQGAAQTWDRLAEHLHSLQAAQ